ncbi:hypothetical protein [Trichloromonas sp.]|uniref:hypothetical protein n=1 Tax=Trichloromonas sp. TaxID=3069249 RepID=UPI002A4D148B|nr:hypothetical protein [Trichloromonas sp.]
MYKKDKIFYSDFIKRKNDAYSMWTIEKEEDPVDVAIKNNSVEYLIEKIGIEKVELALRKLKIKKIKKGS